MGDRNPLTGLPGNPAIEAALKEMLKTGRGRVAYIDIISFKPFNDHYGFAMGDAVIRRLAGILEDNLGSRFVGHIGGDDFICAGSDEGFTESVEQARERFRSTVPGFYTPRDRQAGGIETMDRNGNYTFFPLLDLSVVLLGCEEHFESVESLAMAAGMEKARQKGVQQLRPVHPVLVRAIEAGLPQTDLKALIEACGVLREEGAVPCLAGILKGRHSWNLRKSAALALGHIGGHHAIELLELSLEDSSPHVRTRSVEGLVLAMGADAGPVIEGSINDSSTWVRRAALRGIGRSGWSRGLPCLKSAAVASAPGPRINTAEERRAALEGIAMTGGKDDAAFLSELCTSEGYFPAEAAFSALCSVGTDLAGRIVLERCKVIPPVLNSWGMAPSILRGLEDLAAKSLEGPPPIAMAAIRFLGGLRTLLTALTVTRLRNALGSSDGELFRGLVLLLERKAIKADMSCIARVAGRLKSGDVIGDRALGAFLSWISARGGVPPSSLLESFIRTGRRPVAASAALAAAALAERGLDSAEKQGNNSSNGLRKDTR